MQSHLLSGNEAARTSGVTPTTEEESVLAEGFTAAAHLPAISTAAVSERMSHINTAGRTQRDAGGELTAPGRVRWRKEQQKY